MTESQNNKDYNAADIERYHSGKMPAAEMHALEKAAMEDPFLADALEGYAFAVTPREDLAAIRDKLLGDKKVLKAVPSFRKQYNWLKAAAVIIFIAGGTWLAFQIGGDKKTTVAIETHQEKKVATERIQKEEMVKIPEQHADSTATVTAKTGQYKLQLEPIELHASDVAPGFSTFLSDSLNTNPEKEAVTAFTYETGKDSLPVFKLGAISADSSKYRLQEKDASFRNINDASNANVANATTRMPLPGYNNSYSAKKRKEDIMGTEGKLSKNAAVTNDTIKNLDIVLQSDNTGVSEVVVSAGKPPEASQRSFELKVDTLEPQEGWAKFDDYIARNIQIPDELKSKPSYAGEVELSFDVDKNGEPVNITVTKSLCNKCDEEAIRLLKAGPKWKKKKAKKGKVTIRF